MVCEGKASRIRIAQHNCARASPVMQGMLESAVQTSDIVLIQEPWVYSDFTSSISHPSFEPLLPTATAGQRPRVMAFVSRSHQSLKVGPRPDIISDPDIQILEVSTPTIQPFFIFNIYNERRGASHIYTLDRIPESLQIPKRCILAGDFNAHHTLWNPLRQECARHENILKLVEDHHLQLLNEPGQATFFRSNTKKTSVIDLTFATMELEPEVVNWCIDDHSHTGSDHVVIRYDVISSQEISPEVPATAKYNWKKANWEKFGEYLIQTAKKIEGSWNLLLENSHFKQNLEKAATVLRDLILEAAEKHVPHLHPSPHSKRWWNEDIKEARCIMKNHLRQWKSSRSSISHDAYKKSRNEYFRSIKKAKDECWKTFLAGAQGQDIFQALKFVKPRKVQRSPVLTHQGANYTTFEEKANLFHNTMFPQPPSFPETQQEENLERRLPWNPVTEKEVQVAIMSSASNKAPGPDGIPFLAIKAAYAVIPEIFNGLYSTLAREGYHPRCWRQATTAVIPKPKKPDYSNPKAYRPVALLNCLGKTLEKIMARRLGYMAERYNLLHKDQFGGRRQRNAVDAAMALAHEVDMAKKPKRMVSALFMDVKGAFDNVSKTRLLGTLSGMGLPQAVINWTNDFLSERKSGMAFDGQKESMKPVVTGIPQGSPISPILFLLYLKPLFDELDKKLPGAWCPSYIDDVAIVVTNATLDKNCRVLEEGAKTVFDWASRNAVRFDDDKSELIHFYRARRADTRPQTSVTLPNGTIVKPGETVRWLGVWLDRKLSFKDHIKIKVDAASRAMGSLNRLANTESGLTPMAVRQLYNSCITPICDFGSEIWYRDQKSMVYRFQTLQNQAMQKILGTFRTTPVAAMSVMAAIPPAHIRLQHSVRRYASRILTLPEQHPIRKRCPATFPPCFETAREPNERNWSSWNDSDCKSKPYQTRLDRVLSHIREWIQPQSEVEEYNFEAAAPWNSTLVDTFIHADTKEKAAAFHNAHVQQLMASERNIICYSDGSMLEGNVGAGAVVLGTEDQYMFRAVNLGREAEVYDAELEGMRQAAAMAVECSMERNNWFTDAYIYLDNQAAIKRVSHLEMGPGQSTAIAMNCIAQQLLDRGIQLHVEWVPGHMGVYGNELADKVAGRATVPSSTICNGGMTTLSFIGRAIREFRTRNWEVHWQTQNSGKHFQGGFTPHPDAILKTNQRLFVATVCQMRTGHGHFNSYLINIPKSGITTTACKCGSRYQTPYHLLYECSSFKEARRELANSCSPGYSNTPLHHINLLYNSKTVQYLQEFLKSSRICTRQWRLQGSESVESEERENVVEEESLECDGEECER